MTIAFKKSARRSKVDDLDRHIGARLRERRVLLGLTQRQLADCLELPAHQIQRYESGANRLYAGQLYLLAQTLDVDLAYFYEDLANAAAARLPTYHRYRLVRAFTSSVSRLPSGHRKAVCEVTRSLAAAGRAEKEPDDHCARAVVPFPARTRDCA